MVFAKCYCHMHAFLVDYYFLEEAGRIIDSAHRGFLTIGRDTRDRRQKVRIFFPYLLFTSLIAAEGQDSSKEKGDFPPSVTSWDGQTQCQHLLYSLEQGKVRIIRDH